MQEMRPRLTVCNCALGPNKTYDNYQTNVFSHACTMHESILGPGGKNANYSYRCKKLRLGRSLGQHAT